jgi:DNA polymerase-3 subunit epsilon
VANNSESPDWPGQAANWAQHVQTDALRAFYASGCPKGDTPISEVDMVALDIETTGLDVTRHAVVSIGAQPFNLSRIALRERRYWVVKPRRELHGKSVTIHRITHSEIARALDISDVLPQLMRLLAGKIAVVHFKAIERPFLDAASRSRFGEGWVFPLIDTMALEARWQRLGWRASLRRWLGKPPNSIRLAESRSRYHLPHYSSHHAGVDALATAELFQAQIAHHFTPDTAVEAFWQ